MARNSMLVRDLILCAIDVLGFGGGGFGIWGWGVGGWGVGGFAGGRYCSIRKTR